ncbi:MAG TPA: AI-2E family transporter [Kofleriaceae bacterium]|jgi:predicted PurR-regulated permease PerM|nr:AI-2E family transporter [Kofleriaceae bacterium]
MAEQPAPRFFIALLIAATSLIGFIMLPIVEALLLAAVFAGVLWPVQQWLTKLFRGRRSVAAGLITFAVVLVLAGPMAALVAFAVRDGADGVRFVSETAHSDDVAALVDHLPASARAVTRDAIDRLPRDPDELVGYAGGYADEAASTVGQALATTGSLAFHTVMMLIAMYFLLVRGHDLVGWLDSVSPLGRGQTLELLVTFRKVSFAVIASAAITAAVQAGAALIGFLIARVPSPFFFALVTFFVAFIPAIGAAVVCLFAALLLLLTGHPYLAAFLACWGLIVVGLVDNLVKPLLIRRGLEIHGAVVFFSLIGGLAAFGPIGLLLGPLLVSLFLALLRIYHRDYTPGDTRVPAVPGLPARSGDPSTAERHDAT